MGLVAGVSDVNYVKTLHIVVAKANILRHLWQLKVGKGHQEMVKNDNSLQVEETKKQTLEVAAMELAKLVLRSYKREQNERGER